MFKEANKSFLIVGFFIIIFLVWLIVNYCDFSAYEIDEIAFYDEQGITLNIWPDGEPEKEEWAEMLEDCLPKSDNLSKLRCSYILEKINSFDDCIVAGFSQRRDSCTTSDGQVFIKE